ncbi:hypothetical protein KUCAC02_012973 [Chaenocephalus aceratus]|uniref:Uncharacterized protein n=1 Tax=Chaenocephalus aceratus TaxID=36190 RepID=A0ACB9XCB8_CHAAC|nr:hypothetical protein KUCAC02_012973 [Chaenocephalus aceratus]
MASVSKVSILDYFNIVFEGENGKIESNCKACGTKIQAKRSVTSNFVTHLKRKHQAMYDDFVKRKDLKREGYSSGFLHSFTTNGGNTRFAHPISTRVGVGGGGGVGGMATLEGGVGGGSGGGLTKFDRHDPRQVLISEAIAKMIVRDLQPVSIVENQGFRELLQLLEPRYTPEPQHYVQSQLLPAYAYQAQIATRQALASVHALSLSLDLWRCFTGATSGYLGVTCHFLTSDWQMHSALLACLPLTGRFSGNRVLSDFDEVCHSHGVSGRAFRVVADPFLATTTTVKPCFLPGFLLSPAPTTGQDVVDGEEEDNSNNEEEGIQNGHADGGEGKDSWEQGLGVGRVDCFSRSLEQCVREGLHSSPQITSTLAKAACFYNYITSAVPPEKLSQVFDGPGLSMGGPGTPPHAARDWAAQLKVLRRLLDSMEFLEEVSGPEELVPGVSERVLLRELTDTLEPFTEAWDMVQGDRQADRMTDRHVSISLALPCVLGLRKHLSETSTPHCPSLLLGLSQSVERRLAPVLEDPLYITATTLDPQFKLTWSSNPDWHRQVLIEELSKHSTASSPIEPNTVLHPQSQTPPTPAPSPASSLSRPCKLFSFIKQRPTTQAKSLEQELAVYLREEPTDEEALHYWRRKAIDFPLLANVAKRALTIPACGTVVENIFTSAGRCLRPETGRVLPKNLETLIYLKANYRLLWT